MPDKEVERIKDSIKEKARQLRAKHKGEKFNPNFVSRNILTMIAVNFVEHRLINVESIKSIKHTVQYMIAAKMVGDKKLYEKLNDYSGDILSVFCDQIEVVDDCGDDYDRAVDRHLARANMDVYDCLNRRNIYYVDAGLAKHNGSAIFLPAYNALINVVGNRHCLEEVLALIKETPESDKNNDKEFHWEAQNIKNFVVFDGKLHITTEDSDEVDVNQDEYVNEFIIDEETDPDKVSMSMFNTSIMKNTIRTYRQVPISKLQDGEEIMIKGGIVYHDPDTNTYKIIGQYELQKFDRYHRLDQMYLAVNYTGSKDKRFWEKISLGNLSKHETQQIDPNSNSEDDKTDKDYLYLFLGSTKIGKTAFRETIGFNEIKELLDRYVQ